MLRNLKGNQYGLTGGQYVFYLSDKVEEKSNLIRIHSLVTVVRKF